MEAVNDSLKNVAKSAEMVRSFLEMGSMDNEALLTVALELLEKTVDILSRAVE